MRYTILLYFIVCISLSTSIVPYKKIKINIVLLGFPQNAKQEREETYMEQGKSAT